MANIAKKPRKLNMEISIGGISQAEMLLFTKHLAMTLKSGFTIVEGLDMLAEQAKGKLKKVLDSILSTIKSGESLSNALLKHPKYFSSLYVNLVKTGEVSGTLEENLSHLAGQMKKIYDLKKKIKSAMMYPMLVFIAVFGLGFSVAVFVLPKILPLFKSLDVDLPTTTRGLIYVAEIFETHGFMILSAFAGISIFGFWFLKRGFVKPLTHRVYLKIPVVNKIIRNVNLEKFCRTLGILLDRGVPVDASLKIVADATDNRVFKSAIYGLLPQIQKGNTLADAAGMYPDLFPKLVVRMIGMGERTGNLGEILQYLSKFYENEVDDTMKDLSTILEPVMLIVIGIVVGTVAIAILGPIYEITGNVSG
jgi:type IV pilus assembly protein PilC